MSAVTPAGGALVRSSIWGLSLRGLNVLLVFGATAILGRSLSTADMGAFFLVLSAAPALVVLSQWGLGMIAIRSIASASTKADAIARMMLRKAAVGTACAAALTVFISAAVVLVDSDERLWQIVLAAGLMGSLLGFQSTAGDVLKGFHRSPAGTFHGGILANALFLGGLVACWVARLEFALFLVFATLVVANLAAAVVSWLVALPSQTCESTPGAEVEGGSLGQAGTPVVLNTLVALLYTKADLWIAAAVLSMADTGLYGAAARLVLLLMLPIEAMEAAVAPVLAQGLSQGSSDTLRRVARRTTALQTLPVFAGCIILWLAGGWLLLLAYGPSYEDASTILAILAAGLLARSTLGPCTYALYLSGNAALMLRYNLLGALVSVVLQVAAAHFYGVIGLAVASSLAVFGVHLVLVLAVRSRVGLNVTMFGRTPLRR